MSEEQEKQANEVKTTKTFKKNELKKFLIDDKPIQQKIEFDLNGEKYEYVVFTKKFRFDTFAEIQEKQNSNVLLVVKGICNEDGSQFFTYEEACSLDTNLASELLKAVVLTNTKKK